MGSIWAVAGLDSGSRPNSYPYRSTSLLTPSIKRRWLVATFNPSRGGAVSGSEVPLVVCVSTDVSVRERVVRRLDDFGPVVMCADLSELRAMLLSAETGVARLPVWPPDLVEPPEPPEPPARMRLGDLSVDPAAHRVTWRDEPLALTRLERELLARLASSPVAVWTYERLFGSVWGGAYLGDTAILHSAVKRLRRKLRTIEGGPHVQTVRGVGYRLDLAR
jgi:two-component system response regulator MtrA